MANGGKIVVWGDDSAKQITDAPPGDDFWKVAPGGARQVLAIRNDGSLALWGVPYIKHDGLLSTIVPPPPAGRFSDAALALECAIAIRESDATVEVWGQFLGGGSVNPPAHLKSLPVSGAAAGSDHCVVIGRDDGKLHKWNSTGEVPAPALPDVKFTQVRSRGTYTIARTDTGRLYGWGANFLYGYYPDYLPHWKDERSADGKEIFHYLDGDYADVAAGNIQKIESVVSGVSYTQQIPHFLARRNDGTVRGWGLNAHGELVTPAGVHFAAIAAGDGFSVGIDTIGRIHHWGDPGAPVISDPGAITSPPTPHFHFALADKPTGQFSSIGAGSRHAAAVAMRVPEAPHVPPSLP
jgi:hypothetical protein